MPTIYILTYQWLLGAHAHYVYNLPVVIRHTSPLYIYIYIYIYIYVTYQWLLGTHAHSIYIYITYQWLLGAHAWSIKRRFPSIHWYKC